MNNKKSNTIRFYSIIIIVFYTVVLNLALISLASAAQTPELKWINQATKTVKKQEALLKKSKQQNTNIDLLSNALKEISQIKSQAQDCITSTEQQVQKLVDDLKTLGEPAKKETKEVMKKRSSLTTQQKEMDKQLSSCKLQVTTITKPGLN